MDEYVKWLEAEPFIPDKPILGCINFRVRLEVGVRVTCGHLAQDAAAIRRAALAVLAATKQDSPGVAEA